MINCIFEPSIDTSSATICKWCGEEKILHNHNRQVPRLYTEEEVREAFMNGHSLCRCVTDNYEEALESADEYIQSLKQLK